MALRTAVRCRENTREMQAIRGGPDQIRMKLGEGYQVSGLQMYLNEVGNHSSPPAGVLGVSAARRSKGPELKKVLNRNRIAPDRAPTRDLTKATTQTLGIPLRFRYIAPLAPAVLTAD